MIARINYSLLVQISSHLTKKSSLIIKSNSYKIINLKKMKKLKELVFGLVVATMFLTSCDKNNSKVDYSVIDGEKVNIQSALELSQAYNDTLIRVNDTVKIPGHNHYCMKYDTLYHKNDSMFNMHYNMFGDEMYKNGMMMSNYSPSTGMMHGGMMNSGKMGMNHMMNDTAIVGDYYRKMHQLHSMHQTYHLGIYK
jgi:hypothetical protein